MLHVRLPGYTYEHQTHLTVLLGNRCWWLFWSLAQEIARLMMEQDKKEYKKIREREKEKEKDRERAAMEKMERRRYEGDYRVILCVLRGEMLTLKCFFHCRNGTIILGTIHFCWVSSHIRRKWSGPELEMSSNTRGTTISLPGSQICMRGTNVSIQTGSRDHSYCSFPVLLCQASSASGARLWERDPLWTFRAPRPPSSPHQTRGR